MRHAACLDLVVVGGGFGGLAVAALAQRLALSSALLEAHTKLGGCAGHFGRGPYTFDAGATALMGLEPGEPLGDLFTLLGVEADWERTSAYRVCLPDREFRITPDARAFEAESARAFPGMERRRRAFWRLQSWVGERLFEAAAEVPRLPVRTPGDLAHDLEILGLPGLMAASTSALTVGQVLGMLGLGRDRPFVSLVAMLLQDTAQAGPEVVPFANAAACLQAYRRGMSRPRGGMKSLADGLGQAFERRDGDLRTATLVDSVELDDNGEFLVRTRRKRDGVLRARNVAFNLPLDRTAALLGRSLDGRIGRRERQARAEWSACTAYLAIRREAVPDDGPLFHQVLQDYDQPIHDGNNVLISLSPLDDEAYGPDDVRVATLSTHVRAEPWQSTVRTEHEQRKALYRERLLQALERALPGSSRSLVHAEFGTPRSFERYTRRTAGLVGGPPVSRRNSNFLAVGSDVFGPGLWVVGDSVFPGQGTMAVVLSAIRVVERITGVSWHRMKSQGLAEKPLGRQAESSSPAAR